MRGSKASLGRPHREQLLAVLVDPLERLHLFSEEDIGPVLEALLGTEVDERLAEDLRMPGDVVDVLLGIDGRYLSAELLETLDDADGGVAVPGVVRGCEP